MDRLPDEVCLACGVTDIAKGIAGLSALAQDELRQDPAGGAVFAFRGRRGDRPKLLYRDGEPSWSHRGAIGSSPMASGFCLYCKVFERGRFAWPGARDGAARLTSAQSAMLREGIDWRRLTWGAPAARVG